MARLLAAAVVALGVSSAHAQYADPNLQNLLAGLMNGGEVTLITPLTTGMLQVTSFRPSVRLDAAETAAYVDRAREELAALGVAQPSAEQEIGRTIKRWRLHLRNGLTLTDLARAINPIVRGWINYYGRFYRSKLISLLLRRIDEYLVRWAMRKYKRLRGRPQRAWRFLATVARREPALFAHWQAGRVAHGLDDRSPVSREAHAGI